MGVKEEGKKREMGVIATVPCTCGSSAARKGGSAIPCSVPSSGFSAFSSGSSAGSTGEASVLEREAAIDSSSAKSGATNTRRRQISARTVTSSSSRQSTLSALSHSSPMRTGRFSNASTTASFRESSSSTEPSSRPTVRSRWVSPQKRRKRFRPSTVTDLAFVPQADRSISVSEE